MSDETGPLTPDNLETVLGIMPYLKAWQPTDQAAQAALYAALARAQGKFPPIPRSRTVTVRTKTGGSYTFSYAPLEVIFDALREPLSAEGLSLSQPLISDNGVTYLDTLLMHAEGGILSARIALPPANGMQELGSALTYLRRYSAQSLLGIATEEDDDGNHAAGNTIQKQQDKAATAVERAPGSGPPPGETPEQRRERIGKFWYGLSVADAKNKVPDIEDLERVQLLWEIETANPKGSRKTLLAALSLRIKQLEGSEGEPTAEPSAAPGTDGPSVPASPSDTPAADAPDGGIASESAADSFLPRVEAALGWIAEAPSSVPNASLWTRTNVLTGVSQGGGGSFGTLAEVPEEWLQRVWEAIPADVRTSVEGLGPENLAKLAKQAK